MLLVEVDLVWKFDEKTAVAWQDALVVPSSAQDSVNVMTAPWKDVRVDAKYIDGPSVTVNLCIGVLVGLAGASHYPTYRSIGVACDC